MILTTPKDYAKLCQDCYKEKSDSDLISTVTSEFKNEPIVLDDKSKNNEGYFGRAYIFTKTEDGRCFIIFAHRGNDEIFDCDNNVRKSLERTPKQIKIASNFVSNTINYCKKGGFIAKRVEHTGHLFGAVVAETLSITEGHTQAITFESPGSKNIIKNKVNFIKKLKIEDEMKRKIITYNTKNSLIKTCNLQAGNVYILTNIGNDHSINEIVSNGFNSEGIAIAIPQKENLNISRL